jgi:hypothetical protein
MSGNQFTPLDYSDPKAAMMLRRILRCSRTATWLIRPGGPEVLVNSYCGQIRIREIL